MGKLTLTTFVSLDGVMQGPGAPREDTSGGFTQGGWFFPHVDEEFGKFMTAVFTRADAFLLGRTTYEIFAAHWPRITDPADPIAGTLNKLPKFVASKTLKQVDWNGSTLIRAVESEVPLLKQRLSRELQVHGSCGLAQTLIAQDLVDEYNIVTVPVVLGNGKRLFGTGAVPAALRLEETRVTSKGVVIATYHRAGKPAYGSFAIEDQ